MIVSDVLIFSFGVLCALLFIYTLAHEPRRISCGILLVLALYAMTVGGLRALGPDYQLADGSLAVGQGEDTLLWMRLFLFIVSFFGGIALCVNGFRVIRREGLSLAHALPLFFGIAGMLWPVSYFLPLVISGWPIVLYRIVSLMIPYVPGMLAAVLLQSLIYAALPKSKHCDFIVVLGAWLKGGRTAGPLLAGRLDRALRVFEAGGRTAVFVVSGGKGTDEKVSEAYAMKQYLVERGVPEAQVIMEDRSTSTAENLRFSKELMVEQAHGSDFNAAIVTSNYHVLRAVILAKSYGLNAYGVGGKTALYYLPAAFIREYIAVIFSYRNLAIYYIAAVLIYQGLEMLVR